MIRSFLPILLVATFMGSQTAYAQQPTLAVKAHFALTQDADGYSGTLELLEDARITPELEKDLWQSGGPEMALDENDPLLKQLATSPLQPATLRLRDAKGNIAAEKKLERAQARLEVQQLHPGHRSFLVSTDFTAAFGSYSGPATQILDLSHRALSFVEARDTFKRDRKTIALGRTGKTDWRIVAAPASSAPGDDILQISCQPDFSQPNSGKFNLTYTRYHWDGSEWVSAQSERSGFWESDRPFPSFAYFPAIPMEAY